MPEGITFTYSCFFELIAERMTRALMQHSNQRTKDQAAREKDQAAREQEMALWKEVFPAALRYCTTKHVLTSRLTAEPSHMNRGCDSMVTPDFRSCAYRQHDDEETLESEGTMLESALSGLRGPPGLQRGNWIPDDMWRGLPPDLQKYFQLLGKRRRQKARRERNKKADLSRQSRQHGPCEQRSPQSWMYPQGGTISGPMGMGFPHPYV